MTNSFIVLVDKAVGEFYLTEDNDLVLVSNGTEKVLRPQDKIHFEACGTVTAADLILAWLKQSNRTQDAQQSASQFLRRWPEGPQIG